MRKIIKDKIIFNTETFCLGYNAVAVGTSTVAIGNEVIAVGNGTITSTTVASQGGGGGQGAGGANTYISGGWVTYPTVIWGPPITPSEPPVVSEKKPSVDGCKCKKCKEFFEFGEPNQTDGTLICWSCRNGY